VFRGSGREVPRGVFVAFFFRGILLSSIHQLTFTCQTTYNISSYQYSHPHTSHYESYPADSYSPTLASSHYSSRVIGPSPRGSAISSSQPQMAGPTTRSCNSTTPGLTASSRAPLQSAMYPESTSRNRGRSIYRVPGCPNLVSTCGDSTTPPTSGSAAHPAGGRLTAGYSTVARDSGHRARSPSCRR
jgi:hypothetical protein